MEKTKAAVSSFSSTSSGEEKREEEIKRNKKQKDNKHPQKEIIYIFNVVQSKLHINVFVLILIKYCI